VGSGCSVWHDGQTRTPAPRLLEHWTQITGVREVSAPGGGHVKVHPFP
jgi:hypothetical protein